MAPINPIIVSHNLDCRVSLEYRHLDAKRWSRMADDFAVILGIDGCANSDRFESANFPASAPSWRFGRHRGSSSPVAVLASLDAACSRAARNPDSHRNRDSDCSTGFELRARYWSST